jgi:hypothetical protein
MFPGCETTGLDSMKHLITIVIIIIIISGSAVLCKDLGRLALGVS